MTQTPRPKTSSWKQPAIFGYTVIIVAFFGLGGWSASAPLDSAIIAGGVVAVESNRKTVQHFEGGIIQEINVRDGDVVSAGDILFRLDSTQAQASLSTVENQYRSLLAQEARLEAEREGKDEITFPDAVLSGAGNPMVAREIADQREQFAQRRETLKGQFDILDSQINQLNSQITGRQIELEAAEAQIALIADQLEGYDSLLRRNLIQKSVVTEIQREQASLRGILGRASADIAQAMASIAEAELQKSQITRQFREEVNEQIVDVRQRSADLREKLVVASDVFTRLEVRAPQSGTVQNLNVFTVGAVVRAGDPLLDIVPDDEPLIVQARVSPVDVDNITAGMTAQLHLPAFQALDLPAMFGTIRTISADRLVDERQGDPYFLALIEVDPDTLPVEVAAEFRPGLPAEIIIPTGERTVLEYLISPIERRMRATMREE